MLLPQKSSPSLRVSETGQTMTDEGITPKVAARRGLLLFFLLLLICSGLAVWFALATQSVISSFFLMWSPGCAAILTRLILGEGWRDVSFHFGGRRTWIAIAVAILAPLAVALVAYGLAWSTGLAQLIPFRPSVSLGFAITLFGAHAAWPLTLLLIVAFFAAELVNATGEEIGWRGYMLTRLIDAGVPQPVLVSGLIWSLWHWPLIFLTAPVMGWPVVLSACIFLVTITSLGCLEARLRLQTGSLWPSVVLHAAWNSFIVEIFNSLNRDGDTSHWTSESGILVAALMVVLAWLFLRGNWKRRRYVE
ncbi:CPBP family intramembrane glutamic endopeptidase [Dictyobacter kobayashii]|uniref:CAAX prenyl protease 2/Lysostaphin resistance protein A-like domain-containing protein n=1 Tax=Dictyobacter kobayashii TaxID=2014872 RepID=A0A402AWL9_9CHLR|nr:CPBP family intramembrane glutamic endopeptidase [Dictyobacter kobayashii]GCE23479.1 hypothetical protein KDK_72790 [Dictyobacter kobayashii]